MGGWAPYFSLAGMFRSSTNTTAFLPMGGPYTPLRRLREGEGEREKERGRRREGEGEREVATKGSYESTCYLSSFDMMISCVWVAVVRAEKFTIFGTYLPREDKRPAMQYIICHTHTHCRLHVSLLHYTCSHQNGTTHIERTCLWEAGQGSCL